MTISIREAEKNDKEVLRNLLYEQHIYHSNLSKDIYDRISKSELITDD